MASRRPPAGVWQEVQGRKRSHHFQTDKSRFRERRPMSTTSSSNAHHPPPMGGDRPFLDALLRNHHFSSLRKTIDLAPEMSSDSKLWVGISLVGKVINIDTLSSFHSLVFEAGIKDMTIRYVGGLSNCRIAVTK
ncbi:hypothetical protein L1987_03745 [Smallanthus sonchifolius]|uniref:Uncharacterized protein n=1 Tax=Smallanthus sonchifolius TaxID=185202 RepID=A0ACB9KBK3_9ASTR|nr:hypothetical protein L1987_03745 [Smallanthus sonchifolius]